ncbi:MAG: replicative DNA helicase, partial [Planctomycetes bacterium]|nr:replicative DNA helicase [Planctomycetota bacterium]
MEKDERILESVLPHNREAEMALLGSMILDREAIGEVSLFLKGEEVGGIPLIEMEDLAIPANELGIDIVAGG